MTILDARAIADDIIGGKGPSNYTVSQVNEVADKIKSVRDYWAARGQNVNRDSNRLNELAMLRDFARA